MRDTYGFPKTIELMKTGQFPVRELVTSVIRVEESVKKDFEVLSSDDVGMEMKIQVSFE
jgi:threonine dehydrogenase-like Zn-dependent dehydrogenase